MKPLVIVSKDTSTEVLRSWAFDLPVNCYEQAKVYVEMQGEIKALERQIRELEAEEMLKINFEKKEGKLVFSNQTIRDAELTMRLKSHEGHLRFTDTIKEFYKERDMAKAQETYFSQMFSVVKNLLYDAKEKERLELVREVRSAQMEGLNE